MDLASQIREGNRNYREAMRLLEECSIQECCVCLTALAPQLLCRHFVCLECLPRLDKCPMCRETIYVLSDAWEKDLEKLTEAAGLTLSMSEEELKQEIPPLNGEIVVRLKRNCYCYDRWRAPPHQWSLTANRNMPNGDLLRALLLNGLKRECNHHFYEGLHFDHKDKVWEIFLGSLKKSI
jgi:hypothetical protein